MEKTENTKRRTGEYPIRICLNGRLAAISQGTPENIDDLAIGYLLAESMIARRDAFVDAVADYESDRCNVVTNEHHSGPIKVLNRVTSAGCSESRLLKKPDRMVPSLRGDSTFLASDLLEQEDTLCSTSGRRLSGESVHACGVGRNGTLEIVREDVGRHNAMDKVIGRAWLDGLDLSCRAMFTTGRISYEMALKAAHAGVCVLVSCKAATNSAVEFANQVNLTLVERCLDGAMRVLSGKERVCGPTEGICTSKTVRTGRGASALLPVRVSGVLVDNGSVLLVSDKPTPDGCWVFPGRYIQIGESVQQCLTKTFRDELGLVVAENGFLCISDCVDASGNSAIEMTFLVKQLFGECKRTNNRDIGQTAKTINARMASPDELRAYGFSEEICELFKQESSLQSNCRDDYCIRRDQQRSVSLSLASAADRCAGSPLKMTLRTVSPPCATSSSGGCSRCSRWMPHWSSPARYDRLPRRRGGEPTEHIDLDVIHGSASP